MRKTLMTNRGTKPLLIMARNLTQSLMRTIHITHPRIAVGENYEPKVNIVKEVVEECCMVEDLEGAEEIANFMKEYMQLTKEPSVVNDKDTPSADHQLTETGVDEVRHVDGEHSGEHDDQPLVRLLGDVIKMNNTEKEDPHMVDPGPKPEDHHHQGDGLSHLHKRSRSEEPPEEANHV
jgi:hypothetical protein